MAKVTVEKIVNGVPTTGNMSAKIESQHLHGCVGGKGVIIFKDHDKLRHLKWDESGHIGFAGIEFGTTAEWAEKRDYRPAEGMLVVYTDHQQIQDEHGNIINIPGIKIGDGNAYLVDKPFITGSLEKQLKEHIEDVVRHITQEERQTWNNKLNYIEPEGDLLEFTRD